MVLLLPGPVVTALRLLKPEVMAPPRQQVAMVPLLDGRDF